CSTRRHRTAFENSRGRGSRASLLPISKRSRGPRMSLSPSSFETDSVLKRRSLRRNRCFATGLLVAAVIVFIGAHAWPGDRFAARLLSAAAEAAMVGGLADWFAITALFRRPLGLPIPHTALIPLRKDDIGRSLGNFVRDNFLDPELLLARLRRENRTLQIAG